MTAAPPVKRPALRYFGGKWMSARWIIDRLPPHRCYVEPFSGAASVLLRKPPAKVEVLNDRSGLVVNFFRVVRDDVDALLELLELTPCASDEFKASRAPSDDPIESARRFFVQAWQGFGGTGGDPASMLGRGFRRNPDRDIAGECIGAADNLRAVAARLRQVSVENMDWSQVLVKYDRRTTCFYVDPPYMMRVRAEVRYDKGYGAFEIDPAEHMALLDALDASKGAVALSGYADPAYDLRLAGWARHERVTRGMQSGTRTEVLWVRGPR